MSTELAPTTPGKLASSPRLRRIAKQSIKTAGQAAALLPRVVDEIERRLPDLDNKSLIGAGSLLERLTQHRAHVAKAAGLGKHLSGPAAGPQTLVNIQFQSDLPLAERIRLIQAEVGGVPLIQPPGASGAVLEAQPEPEAPSVAPAPENRPRAVLPAPTLEDRIADL